MAKKYRLLKDLLIGGLDNELSIPVGAVFHRHDGRYECDMVNNRKPCVGATFVENNPEWFEEVKEKQRIEVTVDGRFDFCGFSKTAYHFNVYSGHRIPKEKFPLIEKAIEQILNDEEEYLFDINHINDHRKYLEGLKEGFEGARREAGLSFYEYETFEDFLKDKK